MNSTKKCRELINSSKNKLNSKISELLNFCQVHTKCNCNIEPNDGKGNNETCWERVGTKLAHFFEDQNEIELLTPKTWVPKTIFKPIHLSQKKNI